MGIDYTKKVPVPSPHDLNSGLHSPRNGLMLSTFGAPANRKYRECGSVSNPKLKRMISTRKITPWLSVTLIEPALNSLSRIMDKVKDDHPDLYPLVRTMGGLCVRLQRGSDTQWSNHAFGTAVDLRVGAADDQGSGLCSRGLITLYSYFHQERWFWGGGFHGSRVDSMHMELSEEFIALSKFA